jgi:hypothetical protein
MGLFQKALKSSLKYILMHDNCTQIYCSLKQFQDENGAFLTNTKIRNIFKKENFKFKQQLNEYDPETNTATRRQIYGFSRPNNPQLKAPIIERQDEPIVLKALSIVGNKQLNVKYEAVHQNQKLKDQTEDRHFLINTLIMQINDLDDKIEGLEHSEKNENGEFDGFINKYGIAKTLIEKVSRDPSSSERRLPRDEGRQVHQLERHEGVHSKI